PLRIGNSLSATDKRASALRRRIVVAGTCTFAERVPALFASDLAAPDDLRAQEICDRLDVAGRQRGARRQRRPAGAKVRFGDAVAALIGIGLFVEVRHRGAGHAAFDHGYKLLAIELTLA